MIDAIVPSRIRGPGPRTRERLHEPCRHLRLRRGHRPRAGPCRRRVSRPARRHEPAPRRRRPRFRTGRSRRLRRRPAERAAAVVAPRRRRRAHRRARRHQARHRDRAGGQDAPQAPAAPAGPRRRRGRRAGHRFAGVGLAARDAQPGDTLWALTKVLYADHARSVEAAEAVKADLREAEAALTEGNVDEAKSKLEDAHAALPTVLSRTARATWRNSTRRSSRSCPATRPARPAAAVAQPDHRDQPGLRDRPGHRLRERHVAHERADRSRTPRRPAAGHRHDDRARHQRDVEERPDRRVGLAIGRQRADEPRRGRAGTQSIEE